MSDRPCQSCSPPTTVFGKQPLILGSLLPYFTDLKAPNETKHIKQPEIYQAKYRALQKLQIRENIIWIIQMGKKILNAFEKEKYGNGLFGRKEIVYSYQ